VALVVGLAVLWLGQPAPSTTRAEEELCAEFASQAQAQAFLEDTPAMARALDPDGDGVACERLLLPGVTPPARAPTPDATPGAPDPAAAVEPLAARLGGTADSFAAATRASGSVAYRPLPGARRVRVFYVENRALVVRLLSKRARGASLDDPDPAHWSLDEAEALARRFVPADAECGARARFAEGWFTPCRSRALAAAVAAEGYRAHGAEGEPGDCLSTFRVAADGRVSAVVVAIGDDEGRADPAPGTPPAGDARATGRPDVRRATVGDGPRSPRGK
jgi:hypothetical protein